VPENLPISCDLGGSRVLRLRAGERAHLHELAHGNPAPDLERTAEVLAPSIAALVYRLDPYPTYVTGRRFDVLSSNRAAQALWTKWPALARPPGQTDDESRLFTVLTIAQESRLITCRGGLLVQPHHTIDDHPALDILVVPGGQGTRRERLNDRLLDWVAEQDIRTKLTTSVCTGAFLLAERGILDGRLATTHWASVDWMREQYSGVVMRDDLRVVDTGHVVTSAGVSAGIDMALHVVARLHENETAAWTARRMEYDRERVDVKQEGE